MNARTITQGNKPLEPRFDAKFIEEHRLIERYLDNKLPPKGARDLETWCRANPEYLNGLKLPDRTQASLKLLEASGAPVDLQEPRPAWWKSPYLLAALCIATLGSLVAVWSLYGKYSLARSQLTDAVQRVHQGSLIQPSTETELRVAPDHAPGIDKARIKVSRSTPQLVDLHIDMSYSKATQFRLIVDKKDQGRALIVNAIAKDSNNDLRLTFNTSGFAAGAYTVRIEALPFRGNGAPLPEGWLTLDVQ